MKCKSIEWGFIRPVGLVLTLLLTAGGCTVGPNYARPELPLPEQWSGAEATAAVDDAAIRQWWTTFDDPVLTALIERSDAGNLDLTAALARIDQSRALYRFAAGENVPTIDATGSYTRSRASANGLAAIPGENSFYAAGVDAFWEIDLFGRIRRSVESARADLEQSVEDYRDVRISLYAEIGRAHV